MHFVQFSNHFDNFSPLNVLQLHPLNYILPDVFTSGVGLAEISFQNVHPDKRYSQKT